MLPEFRSALQVESREVGNRQDGGGLFSFIFGQQSTVIDGYNYGTAAQAIRQAIADLERYRKRHEGGRDTAKHLRRVQELKLDRLHEDKKIAESEGHYGRENTIQQEIDRVAAPRYR